MAGEEPGCSLKSGRKGIWSLPGSSHPYLPLKKSSYSGHKMAVRGQGLCQLLKADDGLIFRTTHF
jgi:hypothetical protein